VTYLGNSLHTKFNLKEEEEVVPSKKGMAFKMTSNDVYSLKDASSDEKSMTMIVCEFKKMLKS